MAVSKQVIVHLDEELHDAVRKWAAAEERSVSAQLRKLLKEALPVQFQPNDD
jgi:hypothetical protein